ncbi:MAG: hypothetical protein JSU63_03065 [Phycisphaerales bacterium]|nr:MAG: hypothetical protein JSU63_03065 [Phycisphaerales bacterium]
MLTIICGCMFSGKTTELLRRLEEFPTPSILAVKHAIDNRYQADAIVSHAGKALPAIAVSGAEQIQSLLRGDLEIVGIDEGHFFDDTLVDVIRSIIQRGIHVIITMLDRDSWAEEFPLAVRLCSLADEPVVKHALCARCGARADRTQRFTPIIDGSMVGGPESFEPRCQRCWTPPPEPPPNGTLGVAH